MLHLKIIWTQPVQSSQYLLTHLRIVKSLKLLALFLSEILSLSC